MATKVKSMLSTVLNVVALSDYRTKRFCYKGPSAGEENVIPAGLSRIASTGFLGIAYVDLVSKEVVSMFSLEPGKIHVVRRPENVFVVVECEEEVHWLVSYSNRFNKSDPTRVESALVRPRTPQEEMQDYLNEVAARAAGAETAQKLRSGQAEIDMSNDDYSEYLEDDAVAPLSVYQMEGMIQIMAEDLKRVQAAEKGQNLDIESEAPAVALKDGKSVATKPAAKAKPEPGGESAGATGGQTDGE